MAYFLVDKLVYFFRFKGNIRIKRVFAYFLYVSLHVREATGKNNG